METGRITLYYRLGIQTLSVEDLPMLKGRRKIVSLPENLFVLPRYLLYTHGLCI